MTLRSLAIVWLGFLLTTAPLRAEKWRMLSGETYEGRLTGVYGDLVLIAVGNGSYSFHVDALDDAALGRVADHLAALPAPVAWKDSKSKVAKSLLPKKLEVLQGKKLVPYDPGTRVEPEFYLVYFGAYWCGPCRRFSPRLVEHYQKLQARWPGRFELIFVGQDENHGNHLEYVREVGMPWPLLKFNAVDSVPVIERWQGNGIPCLVVLTRDGDLIYHSYRGEKYLGPDDPVEKFQALLERLDQGSKPSRPRHRLAVSRHVKAAQGASRPPQPYLITFDPARLRTLDVPEIRAKLTIDPKGRVTDASFTPSLGAVLEDQMSRVAADWLFLPAVKDGQTITLTVEVPLLNGAKK